MFRRSVTVAASTGEKRRLSRQRRPPLSPAARRPAESPGPREGGLAAAPGLPGGALAHACSSHRLSASLSRGNQMREEQ